MQQQKPEALYRNANAAERERLATQVVLEHKESIEAYVRKVVPPNSREDAKQSALEGLLIALEKYDESIAGPDRGKKSFWGYALPYVRNEVQKWMSVGVYWRKDTNRGKSPQRQAAFAEAKRQRTQLSMDMLMGGCSDSDHVFEGDEEPNTLYAMIPDPIATPETLVEEKELAERFISQLNAEEIEELESCHYLTLKGRVKALTQGSESDGADMPGNSVCGGRDTVRP